jgi:coiled-coil domain-containing protein 77
MIESLQLCDVKHSDMHKLQWMLGEREEELFAHQRAVKDKDLQIFDVQEELLQLRTENQQLRVQEMEDRKRIQHLLSLTQPVTQETTFMRDGAQFLPSQPGPSVAVFGSCNSQISADEAFWNWILAEQSAHISSPRSPRVAPGVSARRAMERHLSLSAQTLTWVPAAVRCF